MYKDICTFIMLYTYIRYTDGNLQYTASIHTIDAPHDTDGEESTWTSSKSKQMKGVDESTQLCICII